MIKFLLLVIPFFVISQTNVSGANGSEVELFWRRFVKNDKSLSFGIIGSSPAFSTIKPLGFLKAFIFKSNAAASMCIKMMSKVL